MRQVGKMLGASAKYFGQLLVSIKYHAVILILRAVVLNISNVAVYAKLKKFLGVSVFQISV